MKKFVVRTLIFISLVGVIAGSLLAVTHRIIRNKAVLNLPDNTTAVILGHSHPECAFNDSLIRNFSNLAESGEPYFYTYFKTLLLLDQHKQIRTVFIDLTNNQIDAGINDWIWGSKYMSYRHARYAPFMKYEDNKVLFSNNPDGYINSLSLSLRRNLNSIFQMSMRFIAKPEGIFTWKGKRLILS